MNSAAHKDLFVTQPERQDGHHGCAQTPEMTSEVDVKIEKSPSHSSIRSTNLPPLPEVPIQLKYEPLTPPRAFGDNLRFAGQLLADSEMTEADNNRIEGSVLSVGCCSDGLDTKSSSFPQEAKEESTSPPPPEGSIVTEEIDTPEETNNSYSDDALPINSEGKSRHFDSEYESGSELEASVSNPPPSPLLSSRKRPAKQMPNGPRKKQGQRPRTAKEWHKREQQRYPHKQVGTAAKKAMISQLRKAAKSTKKSRSRKKVQKLAKAGFDPRASGEGNSLGNQREDLASLEALPEISASSRTTYSEQLFHYIDANPKMDVHRCKLDWGEICAVARSLGYKKIALKDGFWKLPAMTFALYTHQMLAVGYMVKRECAAEGPFGSILADTMGLGKTVTALATVIANPSTDDKKKTTLIVVPCSVKDQWFSEIKRHSESLGDKTMIFKKLDIDNSLVKMGMCDIVLTTYWELLQSLPHPDKKTIQGWVALMKEDRDFDLFDAYEDWVAAHEKEKGLLHQMCWYRVVLDEGHIIKNYMGRTSRAAVHLNSVYRHLMSANPIMNHYTEFYAILRFLREPVTRGLAYAQFEQLFCDEENDVSIDALTVVVHDLVLRRTMNDKILGKPIIQPPLPSSHSMVKDVVMHPAERLLNGAFEARVRELGLEKFDKGDDRKKLKNGLSMVTRYKQCAANPDLVAPQIIAIFDLDQLQLLQKMTKAMKVRNRPGATPNMFYDRYSVWIEEKKSGAYQSLLPEAEIESVCEKCNEPTEELMIITTCEHKFCGACLDENAPLTLDDEREEEQNLCPDCRRPFRDSQLKNFHNQPKPTKQGRNPQSRSANRGALDACAFRPTLDSEWGNKWLQQYDDGEIDILPSAKLEALVLQVRDWLASFPDEKIIIFTQSRHFQIMVGGRFQRLKIGYVYFAGGMSSNQRTKAINAMKNDSKVKVMVAGLKCGGLGLNLTFANRVIIVDMWWNVCVDLQALGRVDRIGQLKSTFLVKLAIRGGTIDSRIRAMQETKSRAISKVMQDKPQPEELKQILKSPADTFKKFIEIYKDWLERGCIDEDYA